MTLLIIGMIAYMLYVKNKYNQTCMGAVVIVMCCDCDKISKLSNRAKIEDQAIQEAKEEEERKVKEEFDRKMKIEEEKKKAEESKIKLS